MSNGEVKRWQAPHMMRYRLPAERESETDHATEAYAVPCSVVLASDHERIVAELKAEIERLKVELGRPYDKVDRLFEANKKHLETIASQKRVIEKLIEQRNVYHTIATEWGATETPFETLEAQIAAIEKGVRSEQR